MHRRDFLIRSAGAAGLLAAFPQLRHASARPASPDAASGPPPFEISLAQWSLQKTLFAKKLDNLDFPKHAKEAYGIDTVEYVDQFFADRPRDAAYLGELRKRCEGEGVRSGLIMVDTAGNLGDEDPAKRAQAVDKHRAWLDAAKALGCHALRVNARGGGSPDELMPRMADSCEKLVEYAAKLDLNFIIENHGGPSSDPDWLAALIRRVPSPWFGSLPDFGNFPKEADRYAAVEKLMPFAKAVSAKSGRFDAEGNVLETDYPRMMRIVLDAGYRGDVGIESGAPTAEEEPGAIRKTKAVLEKIRAAQPVLRPIWNGRDLEGWVKVAGGDWAIEDGTIVARNGKDWSTDPSRTGSWLRTEKEYGDFELALEYTVKRGSNSGIFIRSGLERNPAFTGYEMQIHDSPGRPPSKGGPGSLYDFAAPTKNRVRPAGEWNEVRIIAKGPSIRVHLNGEMIVDTKGDRSPRGYIGLQNHDERSEARFRSITLAEL